MITLVTRPTDYAAVRMVPKVPLVDLSKGWITGSMPPHLRRTGRGRPRVLVDNEAIGRLAAAHFLERGFRHIALFNFGNWWMETDRIPAFRKTVQAAGAHYHEIPYYRHFSSQGPRPAARNRTAHEWLVKTIRQLPKPLGIFAATDDLALSVLRACDDAGVSVPDEVAVMGCDNEPMICEFAPVPLSSVDAALEQQGYVAAQLLDRLMDGESAPREPIFIPPRGVVMRQSTNILAVEHPSVARALRFIWEHHHERIQTKDIVAVTGLSRRGLEKAFPQHVHRTIAAELKRCRIEHAKELLLKTNLKAEQVAELTGFSNMGHFSQVFWRIVGERPSHFRRRHASPG